MAFPLRTDGARHGDLELVDSHVVAVDVAAAADRGPNGGPAAAPDAGTTHDHHAAVWPHLEPRALADPIASDVDVEDKEFTASSRGRQLQLDDLNVLPELAGLPEREVAYARAARAKNTLRGYRTDWADFTTGCTAHGAEPMPATPAALTGYLVVLAQAGARLEPCPGACPRSSSPTPVPDTPTPPPTPRHGHVGRHPPRPRRPAGAGGPADAAAAVRRARGLPDHAQLARPGRDGLGTPFQVSSQSTRAGPARGPRPRPAAGRLRRRPAPQRAHALDLADVAEHPNGLVLSLPRSKTNQTGEHAELVVLPRAGNPDRCPVVALQRWLELADITEGPVFQGVTRANRAGQGRLHPESVTTLVKGALARAGAPTMGYSGHSLRAGFVTYAHLRGSSDRAIARQTRHRSMASLGGDIRVTHAWTYNAATALSL